MKNRYAIVLAAGQGTRMKSKLYKVLHPDLGQPMIRYVMDGLKPSEVEELVTVEGHGAEDVMAEIREASQFDIQKEQLETANAVLEAESILRDKEGTTMVVC